MEQMRIAPQHLFDIPPGGVTAMYTRMGRALWFCQCFEESLAYHLCLLYAIPRGTAEEIAARTLVEKRRKTLGQLVQETAAKSDPRIPAEFERRLRRFTEERNWLVHRVQSENHTDLYHKERFDLLIGRLDALKVEAQGLAKVFDTFSDDWFLTQGYSQEQLVRRMEQTLSEWKTT
jgi:hypothetical protein